MNTDNTNVKIFENDLFKIRTTFIDDEPWFIAKDVAEILNYSDTEAMTRRLDNEESMRIRLEGMNMKSRVINESGVRKAIQFSQKISSREKEDILKILFPNNKSVFLYSRKEIEFLDSLKQSLQPFGIEGTSQFGNILNYRLDFYIPKLNIVIEYDEEYHEHNIDEDKLRQKEIERELGCKFIRVSNKDTDSWNIGYVIKEILTFRGISL